MTSSVAAAGEVSVEGEHLGRIEGFRFVPDTTEGQADQKAVLSAALRALRQDLPARLQAFTGSRRRRAGVRLAVARLLGRRSRRAPAAERRHPGAQGRGAAVRPSRRTGARGSAQARRHLGRDAHSSRPQRVDGCPRHGGTAGRRARHHLPALREPRRAGAPADRGAARPAQRRGSQGAGAARRAGRRLFALLPEHAEAGADPAARRALDGRQQPRDHPAAAGRGPHLDGSAARRAARFLRHHRLPAAGRPRHPRRHGRAPGGDGAPCRARKPRGCAPRAAAAAASKPKKPTPTPTARPPPPLAPSTDEISEWAIVAAAFGESEPTPAEPVAEAAAGSSAAADRRSRPRASRSRPRRAAAESSRSRLRPRPPTDRRDRHGRGDDGRRGARRGPVGQRLRPEAGSKSRRSRKPSRKRPRRQARVRCRPAGSGRRRR